MLTAAPSATERVRKLLLGIILDRSMGPGDRFPSEEELCRTFGASRPTVREVLRQLEHERVLYCVRGRGRFLATHPEVYRDSITELSSVTELAARLGFKLSTRVHTVSKRSPTAIEAETLELPEDAMVVELDRTRAAEGEPIIYSIDVFPERIVKGFPEEAAWNGSLMRLMEDSWGIRLAYTESMIQAVKLPTSIARHMGVKPDLPWMLFEQTNFDPSRRPVLYSKDYHRGDKFSFRLIRKRTALWRRESEAP